MKKSEKNDLFKWCASLSDKEIEKAYYDSVYDSLGSFCDDMYEFGYDLRDIEERQKFEKYLGEKADILGTLCRLRGIKLWEGK